MADVTWDTSQIDRLAADLGKGTRKTVVEARAVVEASALQTKTIARRRASGIAHAPAYPNAITYDIHGLTAEIGPDKALRQGALGNILEYGTSKNGPIPHLGPALTEAGPEFVEGITAVGVKGIL